MSISSLMSNDVILAELKQAIGGGGTPVSVVPPLSETASVISLPIVGAWSATNNVLKSSSATALEWGTDAGSLTFSSPLVNTAGAVSLNVGDYLLTSAVVPPSTSSSLTLNTGGVAGTAGQVLTATATKGLAAWTTLTPTNYTFTQPLVNTDGDVALPIAGVWSASNNVVKSSSATALAWGTDESSLTFSSPLENEGGNVSLVLSSYFQVSGSELTLGTTNVGTNFQILANNTTGVSPTLTWIDAGQSVYTIPTKPIISWVSTSAQFSITTGSGLELTSFKSGNGVFTAGGLSEITATLSVATDSGVSVSFVGTGWFPAIEPDSFGTPVMVNAWCFNADGAITTPCRATGSLTIDGALTLSIISTPVALAIGDSITLDYGQFTYTSQ